MKIPQEYIDLHRKCYGNDEVARKVMCSCFSCLSNFNGHDITEVKYEMHGDRSSLCPICNEDTVIPESLDTNTLESLHRYFLTPLK